MKKIINWFFSKFSLFFLLLFWFLRGTFKTQPIRWFVAILSISLGVGLAVSINIVNKSAISEFNHSSNLLRGNASFQITGKSGFFNELIFDEFVELKKQFGFSEVSPVINLAVIANNNESVNLLGMDFFRVINTTPSLSVIPENDTELTVFPKEKIKSNRLSFIDENSIFISNTIKKKLNVSTGDNLKISYAGKEIFFNIAGGLSTSIDRDIAVIDIAAFQKKFGFYGKISRLDIKVLNDFSIEKSKSLVDRYLKEKNYIHLIETVGVTDLQKKNNNLSRAYYVNLSILGLVALFTGMFLLYSVMTTSVQQQISEFALMRTIGLSKNELLLVVIMMGTFLSLVGSLIGVFAGLIIAKILISFLNGDLGANLIFQNASNMQIDWLILFGFLLLGVLVGLIASIIPANQISKISPIQIIKFSKRKKIYFPTLSLFNFMIIILLAVIFLFLPDYKNIFIFSYISICLILFAFVGFIPNLSSFIFSIVYKIFSKSLLKKSWIWLGFNRVKNTSDDTAPIISTLVASFALTISIVIMVSSFKVSMITWLDKLLIADIYGNIKTESGYSDIDEFIREKIIQTKGIDKVEFSKTFPISLNSSKVSIDLIIRKFQHNERENKLPLIGPRLEIKEIKKHISKSTQNTVVYLSESMKNLYQFKLGDKFNLPLPFSKFTYAMVGGFYRDYSRQHGSVVMRSSDFFVLTKKNIVSSLAVWLDGSADSEEIISSIKSYGEVLSQVKFTNATKIREISIKIFERTFLIAYLLGFIALFISIFSLVCVYIVQAKIREKEFLVLSHLGVSNFKILLQTAFESTIICCFGVLWGLCAGICISLILVFFINPQSFNWTMDFNFPFISISVMSILVVLAAVTSSILAVRVSFKKISLEKEGRVLV